MPGIDLTAYDSFRQLISRRSIRAPTFKSNLEAMEGVELMAASCQLGDRVLILARGGQMPLHRAGVLLLDLVACFTNPIEHAGRVIEIGKELREYEK